MDTAKGERMRSGFQFVVFLSLLVLVLLWSCSGRQEASPAVEDEQRELSTEDMEAIRAEERARIQAELSNSPPLPVEETLPYRACAEDVDCLYVTNGCCDCVNGGEDMAVNKEQLEAFRARFSCSGRCTMIGALPACGSGALACEGGLCVYHRKPQPIVLPAE